VPEPQDAGVAAVARSRVPVETDFAFAAWKHPGEHAQQRGLARTIVAFDQHGFAAAQAEIQRTEHGLVVA
jgi:hypothetical protein